MIEAKILQIIDKFTVVIDIGENHDISVGTKFNLFQIIDPTPENKSYLGSREQGIEKPIGKGTVQHVQSKISILTSSEIENPYTEKIESSENYMSPFSNRKIKTIEHDNQQKPFNINESMLGALIAKKITN